VTLLENQLVRLNKVQMRYKISEKLVFYLKSPSISVFMNNG